MKKVGWSSILVAAMLLAVAVIGEAQQLARIPRIGYLATVSRSAIAVRIEAFRQGLRELGYVEGKNIVIEWRFAEGKLDRLPALAAQAFKVRHQYLDVLSPKDIETAFLAADKGRADAVLTLGSPVLASQRTQFK